MGNIMQTSKGVIHHPQSALFFTLDKDCDPTQYKERNQPLSLYTDVATDFEEKIEGLWTGYQSLAINWFTS